MNESFLTKLAWKVLNSHDFGFSLMRARYLDCFRQPKQPRANSTIWIGIKSAVGSLSSNVFCTIGDGSSIRFWLDDWLGYTIGDKIGVPHFIRPFLLQPVSDFYYDGRWHFTELFLVAFPHIVHDILQLPIGGDSDNRYWKHSLRGQVTSKLAYNVRSNYHLNTQWGKWIWSQHIPVRRSMLCLRVILNKLPTFDCLRRQGLHGPNFCCLCFCEEETIDHIFWQCNLARAAWKSFCDWFGIQVPHVMDINSFFVYAMGISFSCQMAQLWKIGVITLCWALWHMRNQVIFENARAASSHILCFVKSSIIEVSSNTSLGPCERRWSDYIISRNLGVKARFPPPPSFLSVTWWPPPPGWIKVNTDGSALGAPGDIFSGGVFRDSISNVTGCFHVAVGSGHALEVELFAAFTAIQLAYRQGWHALWLETDSTYVVHVLSERSSEVPWRFITLWHKITGFLSHMQFRVSHIYREGNTVANIMAHHDTPDGWWTSAIPIISDAVQRDIFTPRLYRKV